MHIGGCQPCDPSTNQTNEDKNPIFRSFFYVLSNRLKQSVKMTSGILRLTEASRAYCGFLWALSSKH